MLELLSDFKNIFGPLRLFDSITFRAICAAVTSFLLCLWLGPWTIRKLTLLKIGQPLREKQEVHKLADLHLSKSGTPTMGGVLIIFSCLVSTILWVRLDVHLTWLVVFAMLSTALLGFWDDYLKVKRKKSKGATARGKLIFQILISVAIVSCLLLHPETQAMASSLYIPSFKEPVLQSVGLLMVGIGVLVITGTSNAVNLTDGLDGLAAGLSVIVAVVLGMFCYAHGQAHISSYLQIPFVRGAAEISITAFALAGACLGFLWFNAHPARVFMGDTGSLSLGATFATIAILINQQLLLLILGGVFVIEALSVILQVGSYKLTGKRIFRMSPIHHHFELGGWKETQVVIRFWIVGSVFALIALMTLKIR